MSEEINPAPEGQDSKGVQVAPPAPINAPAKFYIAKERCWIAADGKSIVKDGDENARVLLAGQRGQEFSEEKMKDLENIGDFFHAVNASLD